MPRGAAITHRVCTQHHMITLLFWAFVALDVAALLFFLVLGLAAAGSSHTSPVAVVLLMLVLPAIPLAGSIWVYLRASTTWWRALAFLLAAAPVVLVVAGQAINDARFHANSNAQGELLFFTDGPHRDLVEAIRRNDAAAMDSLLPRADVNATGMNEMTLLILALRQLRATPTQHDVVRALLAAGADPNAGTAYERPLEMVLQINERTGPAPVAMLLAAGALPNRVNSSGTPIFFAGAGNLSSLETLTLLLRHGADLQAASTTGETILIYAASAHNWKAARFLLQQGADPTQGRSRTGQTFSEMVNAYVQQQTEQRGPLDSTVTDTALRDVLNMLRSPSGQRPPQDAMATVVTPAWAEIAWRTEASARALVRDSSVKPSVIMADLDGDGRDDVAWVVRHQETGQRGVLIVHASGRRAQQCGAGVTFGNGGDNFDWMDHWEAVPRARGPGAALLVSKAEAASAQIEFVEGRYQWRQRGD